MEPDLTQLAEVNKAFSLQSQKYDDYDTRNTVLTWMRAQVRKHALSFLKRGDKLLELNSGTGLDAVFFAKNGFDVHCTDISDGMIKQIKKKVEQSALPGKLTFQQCSYTQLDKINNKKFDFIFSNFGGLNCIPDLREVTRFFPSLLNNNGKVCFVVMPLVCPWEITQLIRGKFSFAFRRFKENGSPAMIEGITFKTYYFSSKDVMKALGKTFKLIRIQSLGIFTPSPQMERVTKKFPRLIKISNRIDELISRTFPFNRIGDHIIITAKYLENR